MNILIVDGNERGASQKYTSLGMDTQYEVYRKVLDNLSKHKLNISIIHPSVNNNYLPNGVSLEDFNGIVWTGSTLNIYDMTPSIINQINLAKNLFTKKNKIFGSCWGLQVLVTAAGGKIRKNPKGLEAVIAKKITINENGLNHDMYKGKKRVFDAFCWHYDDTELLPANSNLLASNDKSEVQSLSFDIKNSSIWAVQYHPEFDPTWIAGLMKMREKILLKEKSFSEKKFFDEQLNCFCNLDKLSNDKAKKKYEDLFNIGAHTKELSNWLKKITD